MTECRHCHRLIDRLPWDRDVWCHVFDDGEPITVYCEFNAEIRARHGSTVAEPPSPERTPRFA